MRTFRVAFIFDVLSLLVVVMHPAAQTANGSLKVTSFPSGARVLIDRVDTGKTTPMSISVAVGDHTVTVTIPNSGWREDQRIVTVVEGNNDLSVTLLPVLTQGPAGPKGDKGDQGEKGDKGDNGDSGASQLAGQRCPAGTFVTGFNAEGRIECGSVTGATVPPEVTITPLTEQAEQIRQAVLSLRGDEGAGLVPFSYPTQLGQLTGNSGLDGFALCQPEDPIAPPAAESPLYGCTPAATVQFAAYGSDIARLTIDVPRLFIDLAGNWSLSPFSGPIGGYLIFNNFHVEVSVPLVDAGNGTRTFGDATLTKATYTVDSHVDLGSSFLAFVGNHFVSSALQAIVDVSVAQITQALRKLPPVVLQPAAEIDSWLTTGQTGDPD